MTRYLSYSNPLILSFLRTLQVSSPEMERVSILWGTGEGDGGERFCFFSPRVVSTKKDCSYAQRRFVRKKDAVSACSGANWIGFIMVGSDLFSF